MIKAGIHACAALVSRCFPFAACGYGRSTGPDSVDAAAAAEGARFDIRSCICDRAVFYK
jgi:hypothetical protein